MKETGLPAFKILLIVGALVATVAVLLAVIGPLRVVDDDNEFALPDSANQPNRVPLADEPGGMMLQVLEYQIDAPSRALSGSVINNSDEAYVNVQVYFDLMDADGARVQVVGDTTRQLEAGETWLFSIPLPLETEVSQAVLASVRGVARQPGAGEAEVTPGQ